MCGLAGVILKQKTRSASDLEVLSGAFEDMMYEADMRGGHATGFAIIDNKGDYLICKRKGDASEFFSYNDVYENLDLVHDGVTCLMGHTRYSTLGSPNRNRNNHPIRTGNTIGTHNGSIHNHKQLFEKYNMERFAEVDSEAIFRLYETSKNAKDFADNRLPDVKGKVAIVWADIEFPDYVYVVKANNPFKLAYIPSLDVFAYGSTTDIIKSGFRGDFEPIKVNRNTMLRINTLTGTIRAKTISIKEPTYRNHYYNSKIGAYVKGSKYANTVPQFVPRFSHSDSQRNLFKNYRASDGSTIKKVSK